MEDGAPVPNKMHSAGRIHIYEVLKVDNVPFANSMDFPQVAIPLLDVIEQISTKIEKFGVESLSKPYLDIASDFAAKMRTDVFSIILKELKSAANSLVQSQIGCCANVYMLNYRIK
eukprot:TRINITY_DN7159_c0_g1_i1.p2 TRINITY_DN7159_c0_g1~~TRINITY_DN7159_c0_g1_i1.p2  ORF type:complete len:116 (+),score=26.41 TRINITY_DN7159_c0_g1_i1:435-782(+)